MRRIMTDRARSRAWIVAILVLLALSAAYALTLAPGLTWANDGADGGDFAAAILTGGVPHPTGYPTYMLLGRLLTFVPMGDPAFELALMSAGLMALAGALLAFTLARELGSVSMAGVTAAALAGIAFGLAPIPWSQAVIAEIHGLHACLLIAVVALVAELERAQGPAKWMWLGLGLLSGLALGNHLTFILLLPALALAVWWLRAADRRPVLLSGLGLLLGLLVYLYIPLAASGKPPINWGGASTWEGFAWLISARPYQHLAFGLPLAEVPQRIAALANLLLEQFGLLGISLAAVGLVYGGGRGRWPRALTYWIVPVYSVFALGYNTADSTAYLIPAYLGVAWWIGLGVHRLLGAVRSWRVGWRGALIAALIAGVLAGVPAAARQVDARHDQRATNFWDEVQALAPIGAFVLTHGTEDTFTLWYEHFGLGRRSDIRVIVVPLAPYRWYRETVAATYTALNVPDPAAGDGSAWLTSLVQDNPGPICETDVTLNSADLPVAAIDCGS
ncbi:MAG: DUF2723 domain-containing protein [Anaerolineales bacterium]